METKHKEVVYTTSSLEKMRNQYLAEKLVRGWTENFVDEDTDEVVPIERSELILEKGTLLDHDVLATVNFYLQSGDVKEVKVSNQKRSGVLIYGHTRIWQATVLLAGDKKKRNYFLYSYSLDKTREIVTDYLEQKVDVPFEIKVLKENDLNTLIPVNIESEDNDFYKVVVSVYCNESSLGESTYIVSAEDAEDAKEQINDYIAEVEKKEDFETTIISAQTVSCTDVIPLEFSKEYFEN